MDVKQYYRRLREIENAISESYPIVISLETADGGKAGLLSEVPRPIAAKLVLEGRAALASEVEQRQFREQQTADKIAAEKSELAKRIQLTLIGDPQLQAAIAQRNLGGGKKNGD